MMLQDIHVSDSQGRTALHLAVEQDDRPSLVQLLQAGADVEACTVAGNTPLHLAAKAGHAHLIPDLSTPTTLSRQNSQGFTPLQEALLYKQWEVAAMLVAAGASPSGPGRTPSLSSLATPLDAAPEPTLLLKALLADPSPTGPLAQALGWRDAAGRTALHTAAAEGHLQRVVNLVKAGADKQLVDPQGSTPLQLAVEGGHTQLVPILADASTLQLGKGPHANLIHLAAERRDVETAAALLAAGAAAGADSQRVAFCSPLAAAEQRGDLNVVTALFSALAVQHRERPHQQQGQEQQQGPQQQGQSQQQHQGPLNQMQPPHPTPPTPQPALQQGQIKLVEVAAAAVTPLATRLEDTPRCAQLMKVVLDVLGLEVAVDVCLEVEQQLLMQAGAAAWEVGGHANFWSRVARGPRYNEYLAEAVLLGWLGAEGRRLVPGRLQRLVPRVGGMLQQQGQGQQQQRCPEQLVAQAVLAAARKRQQEASNLLRDCAELHWGVNGHAGISSASQQGPQGGAAAGAASRSASLSVPPPVKLVHAGMKAAAREQYAKQGWAVDMDEVEAWPPLMVEYKSRFLRPREVYHAFLSAWVAARGASSSGLVAAVVAAVTTAQQQQQQQSPAAEQQQQQE